VNSERETPRSRAARDSSRSSSGSRAIVVAFFLASAVTRRVARVKARRPPGTHRNKSTRRLCRNCVRCARNRRRIPPLTESHQRVPSSGKSSISLRVEVARYRSVHFARVAFQACAFNHSAISPLLESITYERLRADYRTRRGRCRRRVRTGLHSAVWRRSAPSTELTCVRPLSLIEQVTVRRECQQRAAVASDWPQRVPVHDGYPVVPRAVYSRRAFREDLG